MAENTLRMKIVTALDNAGIKATKDQIDGLEKQISKINKSGDQKGGLNSLFQIFGRFPGKIGQVSRMLGGFEKSAEQAGKLFPSLAKGAEQAGNASVSAAGNVGKLAGSLGKVAKLAGPIGATIAAIAAAPKLTKGLANVLTNGTGVASWNNTKDFFKSIGEKTKDWTKNFFTGGAYNEAKEAEKKNQDQQLADMKKLGELQDKAFSNSIDYQVKQMKSLQKEQEKVISNIKQATNEYLSQAQTLSNLQSSHNDAKVIQMERAKAADMESARSWGWSDEEVSQVEKAWNIRIAQQKIQSQNEMGNQAWMVQNTKAQQTALQLQQAMKITDQAKSNVDSIQQKLDAIEGNSPRAMRKRQSLEKILEDRKLEYEKAASNEQSLVAQMNNDYMQLYDIDQKRANARYAGMTDLGLQIGEFERLSQNGTNPLGFEWQKDDIEQFQQMFQQSNTDLDTTMTNSAQIIVDALRELMTFK